MRGWQGVEGDKVCYWGECVRKRWPRALRFGVGPGTDTGDTGDCWRARASSFPREAVLDLVPSAWARPARLWGCQPSFRCGAEVGKEEEDNNVLPTSWAKGPSGRNF